MTLSRGLPLTSSCAQHHFMTVWHRCLTPSGRLGRRQPYRAQHLGEVGRVNSFTLRLPILREGVVPQSVDPLRPCLGFAQPGFQAPRGPSSPPARTSWPRDGPRAARWPRARRSGLCRSRSFVALQAPDAGLCDPDLGVHAKAHVAPLAGHRRGKAEYPLALALRRPGFQPESPYRAIAMGFVAGGDLLGS